MTHSFFRKSIVLLITCIASLCFSHAWAEEATRKVVVMTSYPEEMMSRFEAAFEKAYPGTRMEIVWSRSGDAMRYLKDNPGRIDVYWTPAQRSFAALAKQGAFMHMPIDMKGLPNKVGGFPISDPELRYVAAEIAGFGFAVNEVRIKEKGLPQPKQWTDLTDLRWQDEIIFPTPSRVGFAPPIVEMVTQGYGWEKGWQVLQQIGANAWQQEEGGPLNTGDDVVQGRVSLRVSIDFFVNSAIANGAPLKFIYPSITGYSPAHVGIFKDAPNLDAAKAFAEYVLSEDGQKILFHPDIRKLPVRPSVYRDKPVAYYDPFAAAVAMPFDFDMKGALHRQGLNNTLFDIMVTERRFRLRELLHKLDDAGRVAGKNQDLQKKVQQARELTMKLPLSRQEADQFATRFVSNFEEEQEPGFNAALLNEWREKVRVNYQEAEQIADHVIAEAGKKGVRP